jgi:hypothetical protein
MKNFYKIAFLFSSLTLLMCHIAFAQNPNWSVNAGAYDFHMYVTLNVSIGCGGQAPSGPITVAAFISGEVRGVGSSSLVVHSSQAQGESISFSVYDEATGQILSGLGSVTFQSDADVIVDLNNGGGGNQDGDIFCDDEDPCPGTYSNTRSDSDGDGVDDACDAYPNEDNRNDSDGDGIPDNSDTDDCGCTSPSDVIAVCVFGVDKRINCSALLNPGTVCGPCDLCPGKSCEDGDPCTVGDSYDAYCNCQPGIEKDSDFDGVCDALDQCPGKDDLRDFDNDGTPDGCDEDAACSTCSPDPLGFLYFCNIPLNKNNMQTFRGKCEDLKDYFDADGHFKSAQNHCGPCSCASIGDIDSDGDGVCDGKDECPDNPLLTKIGNCSCEDDDDNGDRIADSCNRSMCSAKGNTEYEWIDHISLAGTNFNGGDNGGFVNHGQNNNVLVAMGQSIDISITPTCLGMDCHLSYAIYADWNGDTDFNDDGEVVAEYRGLEGFAASVVVPDHAVYKIALRIIVDYGRITGPCDTHIEGEVEDFMLRLADACATTSDLFEYDTDLPITDLSDGANWASVWTVDSASPDSEARILQASLFHPDFKSYGNKLGILTPAGASLSFFRSLSTEYPLWVSFLYMQEAGKGAFSLELLDGAVQLNVNADGSMSLNDSPVPTSLSKGRVYRFLFHIDQGTDGMLSVRFWVNDSDVDTRSPDLVLSVVAPVPAAVSSLKITTSGNGDFIPTAHYFDEFSIGCTLNQITEIRTTQKIKLKHLVKNNANKLKVNSNSILNVLSMNVYPNPVSNDAPVYINIENRLFFGGTIQIVSLTGRVIHTEQVFGSNTAINTNQLDPGIYLLILKSNNQTVQRKLIVK